MQGVGMRNATVDLDHPCAIPREMIDGSDLISHELDFAVNRFTHKLTSRFGAPQSVNCVEKSLIEREQMGSHLINFNIATR